MYQVQGYSSPSKNYFLQTRIESTFPLHVHDIETKQQGKAHILRHETHVIQSFLKGWVTRWRLESRVSTSARVLHLCHFLGKPYWNRRGKGPSTCYYLELKSDCNSVTKYNLFANFCLVCKSPDILLTGRADSSSSPLNRTDRCAQDPSSYNTAKPVSLDSLLTKSKVPV